MKQIKLSRNVPNELLYGRVGYLWSCLFLNKHIGDGTIPSTTTVRLPFYLINPSFMVFMVFYF